ncbi:MAG TPA: hypothetical protein VHB21_24945 [Minicystis sp.]|nr:hypothetical protein [Minicystis sp.]
MRALGLVLAVAFVSACGSSSTGGGATGEMASSGSSMGGAGGDGSAAHAGSSESTGAATGGCGPSGSASAGQGGAGGAATSSSTTSMATGGGGAASSSTGGGDGCPDGETRCSGQCVDLNADDQNCGACGVTCDKTFHFDPTSAGETDKGVARWAFDVKDQGQDAASIAASLSRAGGAGNFDAVRVAWFPQHALQQGGTALGAAAKASIDEEVQLANVVGASKGVFLSPKTGTIDPYYVASSGKIDVTRWVAAMELSRDDYIQHHGKIVAYNGPTNEPDNTNGKFDAQIFVQIRGAMHGWGVTNNVGPCTFQSEDGASWLPTIAGTISHATTHAIGDTTLAGYKHFFHAAEQVNLTAWNSELHSLAEALVGADRGMARAIWWGNITKERGDFVQHSRSARVFYGEFGSFGAVAGYRDAAPNGLLIFIGNKDDQHGYALRFRSSTAVSFDGSAPRTSDTESVPPGGEKVVHVTW